MDTVKIFDTTLRDGEQSPGASMNTEEKLRVALALERLKVDALEAGFPISSQGDFEAVKLIADKVRGVQVTGLARAGREDIDRAWEALKGGANPRIHTFLATSPIHMEHKLKKRPDEVLELAVEAVKHACRYTSNVEFSAEDAYRSDLDFLCRVVEAAIDAGAATINIPDTVGYAIPSEFGALIATLMVRVPNIHKAVLSVHCHNDLGLAVANSLAGVQVGARQVECTVNGIGERAGNASLEEVVMALKTRGDVFHVRSSVHTEKLYPASKLVQQVTGNPVQRNKAIVGQNAFAHEAGIHQHGMLTHRETYEIMRPEEVGFTRSQLVLGKHSGRHALKERLVELGYRLKDEQLEKVFTDFKLLADKKKEIYDADLEALVIHGQLLHGKALWELAALSTTSGTGTLPAASISLVKSGGERFQDASAGDGPVDAVFKAIEKITGIEAKLRDYRIQAVTVGEDAQGEVSLEVEHATGTYRGRAISTDVIEGSARAFLDVVNRIALRIKPEDEEQEAKSALGRV